MAITSITDVVVPEVYMDYMLDVERSVQTNAFFQSGVIVVSPVINSFLAQGGEDFKLPFWKKTAITNTVPSAVNEGDTLTPNKVTAGKQVCRRQFSETSFSSYDVAAVLAGANPATALLMAIEDMWNNTRSRVLVKSLMGLVSDNITNDSGDLVNDITAAVTKTFNANAAIDTVAKVGAFQSELTAVAVHPTVYATMQKLNLITFEPLSAQNIIFPTFLGKRVIVDDQLVNLETVGTVASTPVYYSVFFRPEAFQYGETQVGYVPVEADRTVLKSGGQDTVAFRKVFAVHPVGWAWSDGAMTTTFPNESDLLVGTHWDRVVTGAKNCGFAVMKSLG